MSDTQLQVEMHKDFFDRCKTAIDSGYYFEALLMEYAAIESRLEIIMGIIGLPCNKNLNAGDRKRIRISDRIECLQVIQKNTEVFSASKLPNGFFKKLKKWTDDRNVFIHGLYKNELQYKARMKKIVEASAQGFSYCKLLYNETKRLRRLVQKDKIPDVYSLCVKKQCDNLRNKKDNKTN